MTVTATHEKEGRVFGFQIRDVDTARRSMRGLAAPYGQTTPIQNGYLEVLAPGCFKKSIREAAHNLPLLAWHNNESWPVGKAVAWQETDEGLIGEWEFATTREAGEAYEMARDGFCTGLSVGFQPIISDVKPGGDTRPTLVTRKEARLVEVSMVPTPAYAAAQVLLVRTAGIVTPRPYLEKWRARRAQIPDTPENLEIGAS